MQVEDALSVRSEPRQSDARVLDALFRRVTGADPRLWGPVIGYGSYRYNYESGREEESCATGFNPKGREIALHIMPGHADFPDIAARLGPHRRGKSCWNVRSLGAVDMAALADLVHAGLVDLARQCARLPE